VARADLDPPSDAPLAFVDDVDAPVLTDSDRHHIERVLRTRVGDPISVSNGRGSWRAARFGDSIELIGPTHVVERRQPELTVAFALTKGGRPELVTQKLTEIGIDRVVPFVAERSVVRWVAGRDTKHLERLRRVAREAAMQCRRVWLPTVADVAPFADVVALPGVSAADRAGTAPNLGRPAIAVGPEGGWTPEERAAFEHRVELGDLVLRAETAAVAAGVLLAGLRSDLVRPRADPSHGTW
jgi:16S rRNA (uracil1498-N3)-methyltransferase